MADHSDTDPDDEERLYDQVRQLEPELSAHITGRCLLTSKEDKRAVFPTICESESPQDPFS